MARLDLMRARSPIGRIAVAAGIVAVVAGIAVVPGAARPAASISTPTTCTADEQAAALAALHKFEQAMPARRRRFFRKHKSKAARRRFLRAQRAKLKKLKAAAACTLVQDGAHIVATVVVPNDGPVAIGLGSVWAEDREGASSSNAQLYRIDPQSGVVTDKIPHVLGGAATVMDGSVWIASFATNRLLRVDPTTDTVTPYPTGPTLDEGPEAVLPVAGQLWVSNHHGGTVALIDPQDGTISSAIPVAPVGPDGAQSLATDGSSVWAAIPGANAIARISVATHTITAHVPSNPPCGGLAADSTAVWVTGGGCGSGGVTRINPATNEVSAQFNTPGQADDVIIAFGSVWVVTSNPNELVRIDPASDQITGRLRLPGAGWGPNGIAADSTSLWIRVNGSVLHVTPQP
jgi:streptogramin lyase